MFDDFLININRMEDGILFICDLFIELEEIMTILLQFDNKF